MFGVPAENLVTQGYGSQFLKVDTGEPPRANRRVTIRRITPLLHREAAPIALAPHPGSLALSDDDRALILENVDPSSEVSLGIGAISEGSPVPGGARLRSFPMIVRERIPALEDYKYIVHENDIGIVDAQRREIVAIIEGNR